MHLIEHDKERDLLRDIVEDADQTCEEFVMFIFVFYRNNFLRTLTDTFFPVLDIKHFMKGIDAGGLKKSFKRLIGGIISFIERDNPIDHRTVGRFDNARLEIVEKDLHDVAGFKQCLIHRIKRYGERIIMLEKGDIVVFIIQFLKHEIHKVAYIFFIV